MNKSYVLLFIILLIFSNICAQQKFNYGLKFGMVSSEFSVDKKENSTFYGDIFKEVRKGPALGLFAEYNINKAVNLDFDLLYLQKGAEDEIELTTVEQPEGTGETVSYDYQLDYIQLTACLNPKISFKRVELQGKFGLSFSVLVETKGLILFKDADDFSTGYLFGGKIIFKDLLQRPLYIEIIKNMDFSPFFKFEPFELTNEAWMFTLGFYYN
jgi:hypothetical protein